MYIEDLTPFKDESGQLLPNCFAIGWLSFGQQFATGITTEQFRQRLRRLCEFPVRIRRGFHTCNLCQHTGAVGTGEVHVRGLDDRIFVAPALISHYVDAHSYLPPSPFVIAVESTTDDAQTVPRSELSDRIIAFADNPTSKNRANFCQLFVGSRVGTRISQRSGTVAPGNYTTKGEPWFAIPTTTWFDGSLMFVVLADVPQVAKQEAGVRFAEYDANNIIEMAAQNNAGIVVQASLPGRHAWVAISRDDISHLPIRKPKK